MRVTNFGAATETQRGRPRDPSRDGAIVGAAIDLLIRDDYDRLTMKGVATAAGVGRGTVDRRWSSKAELVIDAITTLRPATDSINSGTLNGDIELLVATSCSPPSQRILQVIVGVCSALPREPELLEAFESCVAEPRIACIHGMLVRAQDRGDLAPEIDVAMAASLVPSLMLQQVLLTGEPPGRIFSEQIVGSVLLPVLGRPPRLLSDELSVSTGSSF